MRAILLLLVVLAGCAQAPKIETAHQKKVRIRQKAINVAILKYTVDDSWTLSDVGKEVKYQEYLQRTEKGIE